MRARGQNSFNTGQDATVLFAEHRWLGPEHPLAQNLK